MAPRLPRPAGFPLKPPNPYVNAPTLPEGEAVDLREVLGGAPGPIEIEIGPGRGGFMFERLAVDPEVTIVGLEIRRKWATIVDGRLRAQGFGARARVFAEDVRFALPRFPSGCARAVFIHFPDPWWKKRHKKRLVASVDLLEQVARVLVPGGELFFQTDVEERASQFEAMVERLPAYEPWNPGFSRIRENPYGAMSPRERRAVADGLPIVRLRFRCLAGLPGRAGASSDR